MTTKTRAEIPAETATAHRSEYDPAVPLDLIGAHPHNIRHDATADDELVDSIRENGLLQPLVVTPGGATGLTYMLIAGHRRLDGLQKAGFTHAPAVIRHDLDEEADQLAAMLVENGRRADLTPIEEAEGFDLLTELGWKLDRIAEATGRSKSLIKARRRLTRLPDKARDAVHDGQVPIDHAIALTELPAAEQKELERHLGGPNFKFNLEQAKHRVERRAEVDQQIADLKAKGVEQRDMPAGAYNVFVINHADHGMVRLGATYSNDPDDHDGCLAFVDDGTKHYPSIALVCTDPGRHDQDLTEQQRERRAEDDAEAAEREQQMAQVRERADAAKIARQLRLDAALSTVKPNPKIDPGLERLLRMALPEILATDGVAYAEEFCNLAGVPADQRDGIGGPSSEWISGIPSLTTPQLVKVLAAFCATQIEQTVDIVRTDQQYSGLKGVDSDLQFVHDWFDLLDQAGHERNDVDNELLTELNPSEEDD